MTAPLWNMNFRRGTPDQGVVLDGCEIPLCQRQLDLPMATIRSAHWNDTPFRVLRSVVAETT
jgi:hypothetical protein